MTDVELRAFDGHRSRLLGLAYRMLGSQAEAEDVVQEAWLRWREVDRGAVDRPDAFLRQVVTRLCLDRLRSAQARREVYTGPWLPEPVVDDEAPRSLDPEAASELASDITYALMLTLERLSPLERAAFLLHDVFDIDFAEVARVLDREPATCRQLAARARVRVREARPRYRVAPEAGERVVSALLQVLRGGDLEALKAMLADDARFISDGGGRVAAVGVPVTGRDRVAQVLHGLARKHPPPPDARILPRWINGLPGWLIQAADGEPIQTVAVDVDPDDAVHGIYVVRNPDKLNHLRVGMS